MQRNSKILSLVLGGMAIIWSSIAVADTDLYFNSPVTSVGTQETIAYFQWESVPAECPWGVMYIDGEKLGGDAAASRMLSLITSAYLSKKNLVRVQYSTDTANHDRCYAKLVQF